MINDNCDDHSPEEAHWARAVDTHIYGIREPEDGR